MDRIAKKSESNDFSSSILFRRSLIYQTKEYFDNSTLHGIRYIAENTRSVWEKFMWFCFSTIAFVAALIIIMSLWEQFQTNPTITGLETDFSNFNISFPTVTVCPTVTILDDETYDFVYNKYANYDNTTTEQIIEFLDILTKLNFHNIQKALELTETFKETFKELKNTNLRKLVFDVIKPIDKILYECSFKGQPNKCHDIFHPIYTQKGLCYAFNSRFKSTVDADIKDDDKRVLNKSDKDWSLRFQPQQELNIFSTSRQEYFGTNIQNEFTFTDFSIQVLVALKSTYTIAEARQLSIKQRKCIFPDEMKLKLFDENYSLSGCIIECWLKKSMKLCKCIPPFYRPQKSYRICNIEDFKCLNQFKSNITTTEGCRYCELNCGEDVFKIDRYKRLDNLKIGDVEIALVGWPLIRYRREVLFGWTDLFVSFGGIAGLFLGFSMLSGVEILYYFTIRACCMLYKDKEELYALESDIMKKSIPKINMSLIPKKQYSNQLKSEIIKVKVRKRLNNKIEVLPTIQSNRNNDSIIVPNFYRGSQQQNGFLEWYRNRLRYRTEQFVYLP